MKNSKFPIFHRNDLQNNVADISKSLKENGAVYIEGFEDQILQSKAEFLSMINIGKSSVIRMGPKVSMENAPSISKILYSNEFIKLKKRYLGFWHRKNIEMFAQNTETMVNPPSGELHFDRRQTFKIWAYFNNVGDDEGPMRVVPKSILGPNGTLALRKSFGLRDLFDQSINVHRPTADTKADIEARAEKVTGSAGTLFVHDTDAWHGASPVKSGHRRWIARSHHRPIKDFLIR